MYRSSQQLFGIKQIREQIRRRIASTESFFGRTASALSGPSTLSSTRWFSSTATEERKEELPKEAKVVIIGGGVIGSSVAYHLGKLGINWGPEVVVLEQSQLTSGTTWHAAGLIETFGSSNETSTSFRKYTRDLYASLEKETGLSTGWIQCGFIELAASKVRLEEFRRVAAFNRFHGVNVQEIGPKEVKELFPLCRTDDILAGFYVKEDGRANPVDVTMSLAKGAKMAGVRFFQGVRVGRLATDQRKGRVTGVYTADGHLIKADYVVNCAGMWARQLGQSHGVTIPNQAAEHYYLITEAIPEVKPHWPVIEDPSSYTYIRPEGAGLLVGLFEPRAAAWKVSGIPDDFSFGSLTPDWERIMPYFDTACSRVPRVNSVGVKTVFCGPESFVPDLSPIIGESPEWRNYFVAAGLNSIGILTGGGVGRCLAHWIAHGLPDVDVTPIHIDRLSPYQTTPEYRAHRTIESLGMVYTCHYPSHDLHTARNAKLSPLHQHLVNQGAYFRDISGWESPGWFAEPGDTPSVDEEGRTGFWERENWFPFWEREHHACRQAVTLTDMSFMTKYHVQGPDAGRLLNRISTANVDAEPGKITYTQWLNQDGCVEADLTVIKLEEADQYMVVAADTVHRHVGTLLKRAVQDLNAQAYVHDVTNAHAQINIQGPNSRKLMQLLTEADLSDAAFPYRTARHVPIGYAWTLLVRITYVGELGYELYVPVEQAVHVYERILRANEEHQLGLRHAGLRALGSLRMEKGYRSYGHDVDNTDHISTVGLGFTCDLKKPGGFIGMEAVQREKESPKLNHRRLVQVLLRNPAPLMCHAEVVHRNKTPVGTVRAASYGFTLGGALGLAMVEAPVGTPFNQSFIDQGDWEVQIGNDFYPASVSLRPLYDPSNSRIRS